MNGKAAKRIRFAAWRSSSSYKQLKREYKIQPYHRRPKSKHWPKHSHKQRLALKYGNFMRYKPIEPAK